ncbi:hypothetical protein I3843_14G001400 [Carya illinoinensis]|nr:hypothetical protein I3843_14G001400 [Carya illinoinensis]
MKATWDDDSSSSDSETSNGESANLCLMAKDDIEQLQAIDWDKHKVVLNTNQSRPSAAQFQKKKQCLRCNTLYLDANNSPTACSFHGHTIGDKGLLALAPPHQGIDGEWSYRSGKRWSCCAEYGENAPRCRLGWHVSYDDGFTLY